MNPKVSIIVPVYRVEKFLERCFKSLKEQTLKDIEIILVDDESPDRSPQMCDEFAKIDSRVRVIHKKNSGLGYARNSGMEVAKGEYIAFVDSDDYVELDMFDIMYKAAVENRADFVRVDNYKERVDGTLLNDRYISPLREGLYNHNEICKYILYPQLGMLPGDDARKYVSCSVWRNIYRREIIEQFQLRFASERDLISEDIPFNMDFMTKCERAVVINKKLYHYIVNEKSLTQIYREDRFGYELILYSELIRRARSLNIYDNECKLRLARHLLARARMCIKSELSQKVSFQEKKSKVLKILNSNEIQKIISYYPISDLPIKYRFVVITEKRKMIFLLNILKNIL